MCGIWAFVNEKNIDFNTIYDAFLKIQHRGPDFSSFKKILENVIIGFHRLSIMDLSEEGNQPFVTFQNNGTILYSITNGEIYNYQKLIKKYNIVTKSHSDCEVILPLYQKIGLDFIKKIGSEFATIIVEIEHEKFKMIVARDPIGVRPLFYSLDNGFMVCSEVKGLIKNCNVNVFPPGHYAIYENGNFMLHQYHSFIYKSIECLQEKAQNKIKTLLINAVQKRLISDRNFGCLLSGGLDSSLIVGIVKYLMPELKFPVFTISFKSGSTDLPYAKLLAENLNLDHHIIEIDEINALTEIEETIYAIESYDITTVRASVLQRLLAKYIFQKTNCKVLLVGENSDELFAGYLYEHNAPSAQALQEDTIRLVKNVHMFDGLRTDRTMAYYGLEVRLPFADVKLVDYVFQLNPEYKVPSKGKVEEKEKEEKGEEQKNIKENVNVKEKGKEKGEKKGEEKGEENSNNNINNIEKYLLRKAFSDSGIIPNEILWRQKEAFSDGVSKVEKSWFQFIQEYIENLVTDEEFYNNNNDNNLPSKEAYYYKKIFLKYYGNQLNVIPYYWMPMWQNEINNPSARVLNVYK